MLQNFVKDSDLRKYHPNLQNEIWSDRSTYEDQIEEGFSRLYNDLHNMNINPRLLMIPLDLKSTTTTVAHAFPVSTTEVISTTGTYKDAVEDLRRFVVNVTSLNGEWTIDLQGSNNNTEWENIDNCSIHPELAQEYTAIFDNEYKYYRYVSTLTNAGSIIYSTYLVEDIFDKGIIYKTFSIIFGDFMKTPGDRYDILRKDYDETYKSFLNSVKFLYDLNDSGTIEQEEIISQKQVYLIR